MGPPHRCRLASVGGLRWGGASRALVVAVLALLQMLGPLLHAHADGRVGSMLGLHVHLVSGQQGLAGAERRFEAPKLVSDEGAAVFLAAEHRGDGRLQPLLIDRPSPGFAPPADASSVILWPANRPQAPPAPSYLRPAATAPPRA